MTRELLILRHGKSDRNSAAEDFRRPLKERGIEHAQRIALWMMTEGAIPDYVVSSPAERSMETARRACNVMGLSDAAVHPDPGLYPGSLEQLLRGLARIPSSARQVLLVGHNPGLEELLEYLSSRAVPATKDGKRFPTAALARLEMPDDWRRLPRGCAELKDLVRPTTLPEKFPYPGPGGELMWDRPAYYYAQSSTIPFRVAEGGLEILIVGSRNRRHYVVPKGIHEPGMTAQASAAKEASEEAGVEGEVWEEPIGTYQYAKWGGICTVEVYPMRVTAVASEDLWQESQRGREWVSPEAAASRLKHQALASMVRKLAQRFARGEVLGKER